MYTGTEVGFSARQVVVGHEVFGVEVVGGPTVGVDLGGVGPERHVGAPVAGLEDGADAEEQEEEGCGEEDGAGVMAGEDKKL